MRRGGPQCRDAELVFYALGSDRSKLLTEVSTDGAVEWIHLAERAP